VGEKKKRGERRRGVEERNEGPTAGGALASRRCFVAPVLIVLNVVIFLSRWI